MTALADITPTVDEVALLLRTRTVGSSQTGGLGSDTGPSELTTFDDTTRPTDTEVQAVVQTALGAVNGRLGVPLTQVADELAPALRYAVTLQTAILIEVSFFRESANEALLNLWGDWLTEAVNGVKETVQGTSARLSWGTLTVGKPAPPWNPWLNADPVPGVDPLTELTHGAVV